MSSEKNGEPSRFLQSLRSDIVIGVFALLISAIATTASWWQTRVVARQLSSQVWPYVTVALTYTAGERLEVRVNNDGLGPAIVQSFVVLVDGKPQRNMVTALHALVGRIDVVRAHAVLNLSSVDAGQVLRASSETTLLSLSSKRVVPALLEQITKRVAVRVCYCSIVDNCWALALAEGESGGRPVSVSACPDEKQNQLREPTQRELQADAL